MSNQATLPTAPQSQSQLDQEKDDALLRLASVDIPAEQRRLKQIQEPTLKGLLQELSGTQLDIMKDLARGLVEMRDWTYEYMNTMSEHVEALEERLDIIEQYGGETTIIPDDAEVLTSAVIGCKNLATHLLSGPFPIGERDEAGKQQLAELLAFAEQAEKIIIDGTLVSDEESDDDDDDDDDELPEIGGTAPEAGPN